MSARTSLINIPFPSLVHPSSLIIYLSQTKIMQVLMTSSAVFFIFLLLTLLLAVLQPQIKQDRFKLHDLERDRKALNKFAKHVKHNPKYSWHKSKNDTCDLIGVTCGPGNLSVVTLRLPAASLVGEIPSSTIGMLYSLRTLSIRINRLSGQIPDDFANLNELRYVYLNNNSFSGPFPSSVTKWTNLVQLDLSDNNFTGTIPSDIINLKKLETLQLQNNTFHGRLPNKVPSSIKSESFSVADNNFIGQIPQNLTKFKTAFSGNIYLCGKPLTKADCINTTIPWQSQPPSDSPSLDHNNKDIKLCTATIAVGSALILLILLSYLRKKLGRAVKEKCDKKKAVKEEKAPGVATMARRGFGGGGEAGTSSSKDDVIGAFVEGERNKLVSFDGGVYSFDLEDLLKASVEVAVLQEGTMVVVKRLKDVVVSKKEFDGVMEGLGKMKNENVVPIHAYYYSKDEKLLVRDYFPAGSLSALLHGSRGSGQTPLDWDHRFRIALSAAKGVAYLHVAGEVVHGNIKSSNILLRQDSKKDASVSDFGLNKLSGGSSSPNTRVTGYRAPEVLKTRKVTFKSDVYSFGVLLLELLTGKAPNQASLGEEGIDLPRWVQSVEREKWTTEVFDVELIRYQNIEEEMVQLLKIAMACVLIEPDQRPTMQKVVQMMEDMNRAETDDKMRQSSDDPSKGSDGHTHLMESRNSPNTVTP